MVLELLLKDLLHMQVACAHANHWSNIKPFLPIWVCKNEITVVTCFFVDTSDVEKTSRFLQPRFTNSSKFKGTKKNHHFIPYGNVIVMKRVSGATGFETAMIANLPL